MSYHSNHGSGLRNTDLPFGVARAVSNLGHLAHEFALSWCWLMKGLAQGAVDPGFSPGCLSSSRKVTQACVCGGSMSCHQTGPGEQSSPKILLLLCLLLYLLPKQDVDSVNDSTFQWEESNCQCRYIEENVLCWLYKLSWKSGKENRDNHRYS